MAPTAASSPCPAASEELGLASGQAELLAALPVVETQTTGFRVAPFLARVTAPVSWRLQEREVAAVVELPVADLARPEVQAEAVRAFPTWPAPRRVRLWRVGGYEVWGVTYRILEPLVPRLLAGEWRLWWSLPATLAVGDGLRRAVSKADIRMRWLAGRCCRSFRPRSS